MHIYIFLIFLTFLVYRDIKERGRNLDNVIFRYHKFVKPAFEEYIKPTRKMADVVIPRGAENTVAIDLVSQHLKYQLTKVLPNKSITVNGSSHCLISISNHDIIDPKYQFFEGRITTIEDNGQIEVLKSIFEDFINGQKLNYHNMFLENLVNDLLALFAKNTNGVGKTDLIVTELDDLKNLQFNENIKRVIYFKVFILAEDHHTHLE